jgi:ABC-type multidrug transport system ATPase subunit
MPSAPALVVDGLCKDYDGRRVLGPLTFAVEQGQVVALLGRNGSGKSTTLAAVAGVVDPTEGTITVGTLGLVPGRDQPDYRRLVAYVPDEPLLFPDMTLRQHARFIAGAWDCPDDGFEELLARLAIDHVVDDVPATFSRGMRQKAGLALAFLRPAALLLIDEPFSGLDDAGRAAFLAMLRERCSAGAAAVVATHARARVDELADLAIRLDEGVVVAQGRPSELVQPVEDDV